MNGTKTSWWTISIIIHIFTRPKTSEEILKINMTMIHNRPFGKSRASLLLAREKLKRLICIYAGAHHKRPRSCSSFLSSHLIPRGLVYQWFWALKMFGIRCISEQSRCLVSNASLNSQDVWYPMHLWTVKMFGIRCISEQSRCLVSHASLNSKNVWYPMYL